jgi:protease I
MKALVIVAEEGYQDLEYSKLKEILEKSGVEVITVSKKIGICKGKLGGSIKATSSIDDIDVSDYDAIIFIGGPGSVRYQHDVQAHLTAQEAVNRDKVLAAICIAPTILAYADVLEGKKATVWNEDGHQRELLENQGAIYVAEDLVVDGKLVTANGPESAEKFGNKILEILKGSNR